MFLRSNAPCISASVFTAFGAARALAAALALSAATSTHADELLDYLDARGLDSLAALRIEALADAAAGEEKAQLLDRLAELFSRMLDASIDPAVQARLLGRADELARGVTSAKGDALRVAAARARYRTAARTAESIRAGMPGDANGAAELLSQQIDSLLEISARAEKRANEIDRRIDSNDAMKAEVLQESKDRETALAGVSRYLAAWSLVYRGFLRDDPKDSDRAVSIFLPLLGGRDGKLAPSEVSEPLRADELYASAILGLALAKAPSGGYAEAARWLDLLDFNDTYPSVRDVRVGWSLVAALEARAFTEARKLLGEIAPREDAGNWARVAASRAVEKGGSDADARQLLREAVALLAAKRELTAIRDLVKKYGEGILGEDGADAGSQGEGKGGFVPQYVRAVRLYDESQTQIAAAGSDKQKLESEPLLRAANSAAVALKSALDAPDAKKFPEAVNACRLMHAWSLRGAGQFAEAAAQFEAVATDSVGDRAEDAARFSILSLDDARRKTTVATERAAFDADLLRRVDAFLARFPGSDHVPELLVRKVAAMAEPSSTDVTDLLRIKPESKDWLVSRRQALEGLYRTFRAGKEPREETGRRYIAVLGELPVDPATGLPSSSSTIARQSLEVLLANEVRATQMAAAMIAALEKSAAAGQFDLREAEEEIAYRRLQLAMLSDRWADVEPALAPFEKPAATKLWADAGLRLAIRGAEAKRRSVPADAAERGAYVACILRAGDAIFARAGGVAVAMEPGAPDAAALTQIAAIVLDARTELVRSNSDRDQAVLGLEFVEIQLKKRPNDGSLLRAGALFAEASGSLDRASDLLRSLVGGLPPRTEPWFNAKVDQLRVLAKLSPERARAVLAQFRALYPDLGPEPHRSRIIEIEKSLPAEQSAEKSAEVPAKVPAEKPSETPAKQAPVDASGAKAAP